MLKEKLFTIGSILIIGTIFSILLVGAILTDTNGQSFFLEKASTKLALAACVFLLSVHTLFFNKRWAQWNVNRMTRFLENKPKFIQTWLGVHKSYSYSRTMLFVAGLLFMAWGIMFGFMTLRGIWLR